MQQSGASLVAQGSMQETPVRFLGWEDPLEEEQVTPPQYQAHNGAESPGTSLSLLARH